MRLFIGIDLPSPIKEKIGRIINSLKECDLDARWVNSKNVHLTLKFLGQVEEEKISLISKSIEGIANEFNILKTEFRYFGFFPNNKKPKVLFIGTDQDNTLKNIFQKLENKLEGLGFKKEDRFKSHITLARLKSLKNITCLKDKIEKLALPDSFIIDKIILFKSTLSNLGPIYEKVFSANFTS